MSDDGSGRSALVKLAHRTGERGKGGGGACGADGEHVAWFWGTKNKKKAGVVFFFHGWWGSCVA